jgi:RNA 2',3'-cyclic 3'-phosphodiesterase
MRVFLALYPDEAARAELADVAPDDADDVRVTDMADWHVTLRFLGELEVAAAEAVADAALGALRSVPPFSLRLGPTTALGTNGRVLFVPAAGAERAAQTLDLALEGLVEDRDGPFRGHLTLARARGRGRLPGNLSGMPVSIAFPVDEAVVVESRLEPDRAVHRVVARLALGSGGST